VVEEVETHRRNLPHLHQQRRLPLDQTHVIQVLVRTVLHVMNTTEDIVSSASVALDLKVIFAKWISVLLVTCSLIVHMEDVNVVTVM